MEHNGPFKDAYDRQDQTLDRVVARHLPRIEVEELSFDEVITDADYIALTEVAVAPI